MMSSTMLESILLSSVSRSCLTGNQYDPDARSCPTWLPRTRTSFTIGLRLSVETPSAPVDRPSRLPTSVVLRPLDSDPRTTLAPGENAFARRFSLSRLRFRDGDPNRRFESVDAGGGAIC